MDLSSLLVVASLVIVSTAVGLWWRSRQGKISHDDGQTIPLSLLAPGHKLTLLQVSSPLCSYCAAMRSQLSREAASREDVAHLEYDVSDIPGIVDALRIRQTPTTLFVEADGRVAHQVGGPLPPPAIRELIDHTLDDVRRRSHGYEI